MLNLIKLIKKRARLIIIGTVAAATIGTASYQSSIIGNSKNKKQQSTKVIRGNLKEELTLSGELDAEEKVTLRFQISGKMTWVGVKQGDRIKKYQVIATLDQRELQKNLTKELNDFLNERWDFDQQRDDYKDQAITDKMKRVLDKAQFDLNNAIIDVEIKDLALELSRLVSPIDGIVTRISNPYAGVNITPAGAEFDIVNPNTLYLSITADQTEITKLKENDQGILYLDPYPDEKITGQIKNISFIPKTGETGTVYIIKFYFDNFENNNEKYRLGMTGDVTFITQQKENVLYLPIKYIKGAKNPYVWVLKNNKKTKQQVVTGLETDNYIEIISGLQEGDVVYD